MCSVCPSVPVNVNTTDATTGAAALLLPAQNPCVSKLTPASFYRISRRRKASSDFYSC